MAGIAAAAAGAAAAVLALRRASLRWGATESEVAMNLPGDELLPAPNLVATRAISIAAPPSKVWPWLTQLGQNRGGFYSYDWLENLLGLNIHSAETIQSELQVQEPGDTIDLAPGAGLSVVRLDAERSLVLGGGVGPGGSGPDGGPGGIGTKPRDIGSSAGAGAGTGRGAGTRRGAPYDITGAFVLR
ncbi:MAG: hypothetical protein ABS909_05705, partial [Arthrobacter sp.]